MGRATRWLKGLLGFKTTETNRRKCASAKIHKENDHMELAGEDEHASNRAIAVAAATAAVAEAAVAAAQAAATVVKLTSNGLSNSFAGSNVGARGGRRGFWNREEWAAVTVQSHFRAYLARKALRALKALVKLQALVRGYIVRRQMTYILRRLQALVRAQSRARVRVGSSESSMKTSYINHLGPATPEKSEQIPVSRSFKYGHSIMLKKSGSLSTETGNHDHARPWKSVSRSNLDDDGSVKILEVDSGSSYSTSKSRRVLYSSYHSLSSDRNCHSFSTSKDTTARHSIVSPSSGEVQSLNQFEFSQYVDDNYDDSLSPTLYSAASSRGLNYNREVYTPTKSDGTRSCNTISYIDHPNYMAYTQSSKAKVRSVSAPKQRLQFERSCSTKRYSIHANGESKTATTMLHRGSVSRCYPGSGLLDRVGMPIGADSTGFSSISHWRRAV